jgi:hypothetical protein
VNESEDFAFAIGRPWYPEKGDSGGICFYSFMGEIQTGTMNQARNLKAYAESKLEGKVEYFIYKIERLEN